MFTVSTGVCVVVTDPVDGSVFTLGFITAAVYAVSITPTIAIAIIRTEGLCNCILPAHRLISKS